MTGHRSHLTEQAHVKYCLPTTPFDTHTITTTPMRLVRLTALAALAAAAPLAAQATPDAQLRMLEHQRTVLLQMTDSMPERLYRVKATPGQRDFAQQIHHAASAAAYIASVTMVTPPKLALPDTGAALNSRAGLRRFVNEAFDYSANVLKAQSAASRNETVDLFGKKMPRGQVWDEIYTHSIWTAGQVVANFRENGMAPPAFTFF